MEKHKKGHRPLSIAAGVFGIVAWIIFLLTAAYFITDKTEVKAWEWILLIILTFASYLLPYFLIKNIYGILAGFSQRNQ